jgi:general secretion pathway protein C
MKWVVVCIGVLFAFVAGFAVGWRLHRPEVVHVETIATASAPTASTPTIAASASATMEIAPSASPLASAPPADTTPFAWPTKSAPPKDVVALDATHYLVDDGFVEDFLAHQETLMRTARVVPEVEDGGVVGIRLFGVRTGTPLTKLGIENGDRLETINGYALSKPEQALEAYTKMRHARQATLAIVRRGTPMTLYYRITHR